MRLVAGCLCCCLLVAVGAKRIDLSSVPVVVSLERAKPSEKDVTIAFSKESGAKLKLGAEPPVCRGVDGAVQACEDYTHAGSLVSGSLNAALALAEALKVQTDLLAVAAPNIALDQCEDRLRVWLAAAAEYYRTGVHDVEAIVPTQNYVMANSQLIQTSCPAAWLVTLVLKVLCRTSGSVVFVGVLVADPTPLWNVCVPCRWRGTCSEAETGSRARACTRRAVCATRGATGRWTDPARATVRTLHTTATALGTATCHCEF
jgi:hypothetical protein